MQAFNALNNVIAYMAAHSQYDMEKMGNLKRKFVLQIRSMLLEVELEHEDILSDDTMLFIRAAKSLCDDIIDELPRDHSMAVYSLYSTIVMAIHTFAHKMR